MNNRSDQRKMDTTLINISSLIKLYGFRSKHCYRQSGQFVQVVHNQPVGRMEKLAWHSSTYGLISGGQLFSDLIPVV